METQDLITVYRPETEKMDADADAQHMLGLCFPSQSQAGEKKKKMKSEAAESHKLCKENLGEA